MQTNVLLIDSNIKYANRVREALQSTGVYNVRVFATGAAALEHLSGTPYDVAVVDFTLQDMDAIDLVTQMRDAYADLHIVAVRDISQPLPDAVPIDDTLPKRYRARDLIHLIELPGQDEQTTQPARKTAPLAAERPPSKQRSLTFEDLFESGEGLRETVSEFKPQSRGKTRQFSTDELEQPYTPRGDDADDASPQIDSAKERGKRPLYELIEDTPPLDEGPPTEPLDADVIGGDEFDAILEAAVTAPPEEDPDDMQSLKEAMKRIAARSDQAAELDMAVAPHTEDMPDWLATELPIVTELTNPTPPRDAAQHSQVALQLTHLAGRSLAEVMLLTRAKQLISYTGEVSPADARQLAKLVWKHWDPHGKPSQTQVQPVRLESLAKDYVLYSIATTDDMVLSMAFAADTPLRQVRRQATEIGRALQSEEQTSSEVLPPEEAAEQIDAEMPTAVITSIPASAAPDPASPPSGDAKQAMAGYTYVWTLRDASKQLGAAHRPDLERWLAEVAARHGWRIQAVELQPGYISVHAEAPAATPPAHVVKVLMDALANHVLEAYPDELGALPGRDVWADAYYVVTPPRALSRREVKRFIDFQRREHEQ